MHEQKPWLPSFARRGERKPTAMQQRLMEELYPKLAVNLEFPTETSFGKTWLELGFGAGEQLVAQAQNEPDTLHIGCEAFRKGMMSCLSKIQKQKIDNIRLYLGDGREVLTALPDRSLDQLRIFFPDPWPKKKHHKRRLIQQPFLTLAASKLKDDGLLLLATDDENYLMWMLRELSLHPAFTWDVTGPLEALQPFENWVPTRYQQKAERAGRRGHFLKWLKIVNSC